MRWWAGLPAGGPPPHLMDGSFLQDFSLRRYLRLAEIGLLQEARRELATLLNRYEADPHRLYQIAVQTERIGDPQLSIAAGRALLEAAECDPRNRPVTFCPPRSSTLSTAYRMCYNARAHSQH
ncbi:MAG: hypothetical protein IIC01_12115 [Planctomycetes bacterium]|nr:hypothetical protein [Planctomycetota bacterium]